jgi:hypothetical protein
MTAAELAGYTLASAAVTARIERAPDGYALRLESPFAGRLLTFTLATPQAATVREVRVDGRPLRRLAPAARVLEPQSWTRDADGISWACDLPAQQIVTVTLLDSAG